jgi:hypothetical protein
MSCIKEGIAHSAWGEQFDQCANAMPLALCPLPVETIKFDREFT